jgi:hypothetical protein
MCLERPLGSSLYRRCLALPTLGRVGGMIFRSWAENRFDETQGELQRETPSARRKAICDLRSLTTEPH